MGSEMCIRDRNLDTYLEAIEHLNGRYDLMLLDCAPGLGTDAMVGIASATELLVVINPEWPSITDALKTIKFAEEIGVPTTGVILNRRRNEPFEPDTQQIEAFLDAPIIAEVPEDKNIRRGVACARPVSVARPNSRAALSYRKVASSLLGLHYEPRISIREKIMEIWRDLVGDF